MNIKNEAMKPRSHSGKNSLHRFIRLTLAGSVLTSGMATAVLQDHGPNDPALTWPVWYRDLNGLPLGLCKSQAPSPNAGAGGAPMCFPITPNPKGFAGNIGDEIFYMNLNADIVNGGIDLRYVTALEAAYGNAAGTPVKGEEIVFARVRFVMSVKTATCTGDYRIIHPWGDQTFVVDQVGPRALFETIDIPLGAFLDFEGALKGPLGPFLHWDGNGDEIPLDRTVAANGLLAGTDQFIGDPSVLHTYTGSPFIETNADGTPKYFLADGITPQHQNYLKVIAPVGCDIGGTPAPAGEGVNVQKEALGFLMGQAWTAAIATPTQITQALFTRTATATTVDVWAKSASNQAMIVTGTGFSGVNMTEEKDDLGVPTGKYQAHLELPGSAALPPVVDVVNVTSNPTLKVSAPLTDIVRINRMDYDPVSNTLCVSAQSSDKSPPAGQNLPELALSGAFAGTLTTTTKPGCTAAVTGDSTIALLVPQGVPGPINRAPDSVRVTSSAFGGYDEQPIVLTGAADNSATLIANPDAFLNVSGSGAQVLDVGANDGSTGEIVIVDQPSISTLDANGQPITQIVGSMTGSLTGGTATFTANSGAAGVATFTYVIRSGNNVSNLASSTIDIQFVAGPPNGSPDNFAVSKTNTTPGFTVNVLQNDVAAVGTTIDSTSVAISTQGTKGVATANGDGTVTYKPNSGVAAGNDAFFYTVANTAGARSLPVRVDVVVENSNESVSITRNKIGNTGAGPRWDLRFTTTWFGAPLTPMGTCYLVRVNNVDIPTPRRIGTASVDATGAVQIQIVGTKLYNAADYNPAVDIPLLPAKTNYTIRCGTSNLVVPLPAASASTADNSTTSP